MKKKNVCIHINTATVVVFHLCQEKRQKERLLEALLLFFYIKKEARELSCHHPSPFILPGNKPQHLLCH